MKVLLRFIMAYIVSVGVANAAVRDANVISRPSNSKTSQVSRTAANSKSVKNSSSRSSMSRNATQKSTARSATSQVGPARKSVTNNKSNPRAKSADTNISRATTTTESNTFGSEYNSCRDAYFTCMDQFCAQQDSTYRRCVCSSRLTQIKSQERLLSETATQLAGFKDLNLNVIDKSANEVDAMLSATDGESAIKKDTSSSSKQLNNISEILNKTKSESLSTAGKLDIGGDIKQIWSTSDLTGGSSIANLTGEALYSAVHSQCSELVSGTCGSKTTLNMVASAYGMYIENDCSAILGDLDDKTENAKGQIRETESQMHTARLENYDAHNSSSMDTCIKDVRTDITANNACGPNFVHCLDTTGRYLNRETGEPIYSGAFYELANQTSLSGDIITNPSNHFLVSELNRMRPYAESSLDKCRDISASVWDEFLRQAIKEIHQSIQEKIRTVKNECLDVVNSCYNTQTESLKDFSNVNAQHLLGQRLELSEELCKEKLTTCSNLYGGGTQGLKELVDTMADITEAKIANDCIASLEEYTKNRCSVTSSDTLHRYPYACRTYTPGEEHYAQRYECNIFGGASLSSQDATKTISNAITFGKFMNCAITNKIYTACNTGYCLYKNVCITGAQKSPEEQKYECLNDPDCGDYNGSFYQYLVRYAMEVCMRPSAERQIPINILQNVNTVMDKLRVDMSSSLSQECINMGGTWVNIKYSEDSADADNLLEAFYDETGSHKSWGYCKKTPTETTTP